MEQIYLELSHLKAGKMTIYQFDILAHLEANHQP